MKTQLTKQAAKKKATSDNLILLAIGIVLAIVGFILLKTSAESEGLLPLIAFVALAFGGLIIVLMPVIVISNNKRINRSYCSMCETKYDYDSDIAWEVTEVIEKDTTETSVVEFECTCHSCKQVVNFTQKFQTARYDTQKNSWKVENIKTLARKYFW